MDSKIKKNLKGLNSDLVILIERVFKKSSLELSISKDGGKRSPQTQNNIFHSKPITTIKDGFKRISKHQSGEAFNITIKNPDDLKFKETSKLFKTEFDLMKEEGLFKNYSTLKWGGDEPRFKFNFHYEIE